ncbi:alpha/beta hydrolase [Pyxidicoccus fallax]|uniref:Alpha/beta hydrolase n=1 Tax=Pyxidicoccus fallax TaxID=394095 RepID=A0A848LE05_9BACT|nr:alpha/beta hydrolase [Pyxidicoccus fallax]NMO16676.1 alpha/beta hydrolase [Pyxidicoccus fallax]NPC79241.1 alpha/beta hydrolase [Pyxidicoccus fallax]
MNSRRDTPHAAETPSPERTANGPVLRLHRREFVTLAAGALAGSVLAGCSAQASRGGVASPMTGERETLDAAAFRASRRYAQTRFGRIAYVERGTGDAALFLHGFPLNNFQWRGAIERLSPHRRCVAPDFLGLGYTEVAEGQSCAPDAQVAMLVTLLDQLSIRSVDVIANDSGGAVAQLLVTRHPDRVRTLLLTNCDTEKDCPPPAILPVIEMARADKYVDTWLAPWLADKVLARSEKGLGGMTYTHSNNPTDEALDYYLTPLVSTPRGRAQVNAYTLALERNALAGIEPALKRCTAPTRILWGTGDTIFSPESPDYLDRTFGASRGVRRVPGAKLFFPEEFPDLIAEEARGLWGVG